MIIQAKRKGIPQIGRKIIHQDKEYMLNSLKKENITIYTKTKLCIIHLIIFSSKYIHKQMPEPNPQLYKKVSTLKNKQINPKK